MLSALSVSSRHQQCLKDKLEVCFQRHVKSIFNPHHSWETAYKGLNQSQMPKGDRRGTHLEFI